MGVGGCEVGHGDQAVLSFGPVVRDPRSVEPELSFLRCNLLNILPAGFAVSPPLSHARS